MMIPLDTDEVFPILYPVPPINPLSTIFRQDPDKKDKLDLSVPQFVPRKSSQKVSEELIERCIAHSTPENETQVIDVWRRYIEYRTRKQGVVGQFHAMERMIEAYRERLDRQGQRLYAKNRFYSEVWLKYAKRVKHPDEVYEVILEYRIGDCFAKTYEKIANYYEKELLDFRKAEKIYRVGLEILREFEQQRASICNIKQVGMIKSFYERFNDRMNKRIEENNLIGQKIQRASRKIEKQPNEIKKIAQETEQLFNNQRKSFLKGEQIVIGGIPIFVDEEFRQDIIPKGIPLVDKFYRQVCFELNRCQVQEKSPSRTSMKEKLNSKENKAGVQDSDNHFVKEFKTRRANVEQERNKMFSSFLDNQPYLKINYKQNSLPLMQLHQQTIEEESKESGQNSSNCLQVKKHDIKINVPRVSSNTFGSAHSSSRSQLLQFQSNSKRNPFSPLTPIHCTQQSQLFSSHGYYDPQSDFLQENAAAPDEQDTPQQELADDNESSHSISSTISVLDFVVTGGPYPLLPPYTQQTRRVSQEITGQQQQQMSMTMVRRQSNNRGASTNVQQSKRPRDPICPNMSIIKEEDYNPLLTSQDLSLSLTSSANGALSV